MIKVSSLVKLYTAAVLGILPAAAAAMNITDKLGMDAALFLALSLMAALIGLISAGKKIIYAFIISLIFSGILLILFSSVSRLLNTAAGASPVEGTAAPALLLLFWSLLAITVLKGNSFNLKDQIKPVLIISMAVMLLSAAEVYLHPYKGGIKNSSADELLILNFMLSVLMAVSAGFMNYAAGILESVMPGRNNSGPTITYTLSLIVLTLFVLLTAVLQFKTKTVLSFEFIAVSCLIAAITGAAEYIKVFLNKFNQQKTTAER